MNRIMHFPSFIVFAMVVLALGWIANITIGLSYWVAVLIIAVAILINGIIMVFEKSGLDEKPDAEN